MTTKAKIAAAVLTVTLSTAAFIRNFEGTVQDAYLDSVGVPTICVGSTKGVFLGQHATLAECEARLVEDSTYAGAAVARFVKVKLTQEQYDSLVSFTFNCGRGALAKSTLLVKLNRGDYCGAGKEFLRWDKANGKRLKGLTKRRAVEAAPFLEECDAR